MCTSSCTHTYTCSNKQLHSYSYSHEEQTHTAKAAYTRATGLYNHTHRLRICVLTHEKRILKHPQEKLMYISCVNNRAHAHNSTKICHIIYTQEHKSIKTQPYTRPNISAKHPVNCPQALIHANCLTRVGKLPCAASCSDLPSSCLYVCTHAPFILGYSSSPVFVYFSYILSYFLRFL